MEERIREMQWDYRGRRSSMMRYSLETKYYPTSAPVPLEPWDRQAILDYRNRVNANSNARLRSDEHYPRMRDVAPAEDADRLRWPRLRDASSSPPRIRRNQDWRFREHDPLFYHHQVHAPSNPNHALDQGRLFRLSGEKRARLELNNDEEFQMRRRPKFLQHEHLRFPPSPPPPPPPPSLPPSVPLPPPFPLPLPHRDVYLPSPRVKWQHDLFEHTPSVTNKQMRDRDVVSFGSSIVGGRGFDGFIAVEDDLSKGVEVDEEVDDEDSRRNLTSLLSDLKDQVLASTPGSRGPELSEIRKEKPHIRGRNQSVNDSVGPMHSKKLKNKIPPSPQSSQKKVKIKKNPTQSSSAPAFVQQEKMSQNGSFSHLIEATPQGEQSSETKYERNTADLSVIFRRSGMVAQEVVSTLDNNWHDFAVTKSFASKGSIPQEDLEEEEGEIKSAESYDALYEGKRLMDHQNRDSQSKTKSMKLPSETISFEKDLIVQGDSTQPPCYVEGIDIGTTSAVQSEERFVPECNYFTLGGRGSDSPATLISNPGDCGQPTAESITTCMAHLKQYNNLSINAPSEPNLTPRVMKEGSSKDTSLTTLADDAIDKLDDKERLQKKLKFEQREKPALNDNVRPEESVLTSSVLQAHTDVMESQGTVTRDQVLTNMMLRSNLSHQSLGVYQCQSSQLENKSSQSTISLPILPQSKLSICSQPTKTKVVASSALAGRSRTWHRTDNVTSSSLVKPQVIQNDATSVVQKVAKKEKSHSAAYVRKGNSLVRAPCPPMGVSCTKSSFAGSLNTDKTTTLKSSSLKVISTTGDIDNVSTGLGSNVGSSGLSSTAAYRASTPAFESPTTPPAVAATKSPVCISTSPESLDPTLMSGTLAEVHVLMTGVQAEDCKTNIKSDVSVTKNLFESQMSNPSLLKRNQTEGHIENALAGQMMHSKWKSNQLVADSIEKKQGSVASICEGVHLPPNCLVQDQYYKRKKNQLVRSNLPMDRKITKPLEFPNVSSLDTESKVQTLKDQRRRTFIQTKLGRVLKQKNHWTSQSSWVWTLDEAETSNMPLLQSRRVTPLLCPWKRPSYVKSGLVGKLKAVPSISKGSPFSLIRKKLKRLQKRDTVYTKSLNGFSLHRSGVLSLGGANLKWTKSIEKCSKEASEEITMAVAATEKKKRDAKAVGNVITSVSKENPVRRSFKPSQGIKSRARKSKQATVEHIVQVGLFRYKMDPSKRTLQMIPAEEPPSNFNTSLARQTMDTSKRFTLKGVTIGDDAYLRVGNGNKLVRDPKKVCRVLASEKVRWSLHTARHRLAKKQQYCQFFTRFGKCNKEDGKCPYIHDREKIAVCTKFLKGNCSNGSCELTHKIIPERMEDCSFFLQGFCTNEKCPYRHVNVNPKAPVCDGFLKGYCADGDKCNKKHTHVCPQYAATGDCPERLSCKLHHPKKKDKPKCSSRRRSGTTAKRRYFVADDLGVSELASKLLRLLSEQQIALESPPRMPECVEFISLDASGEGVDDINLANGAMSSMKRSEIDLFSNGGLPVDDIDMMIKPVRLLRKEQTVHTCRAKGIEKQMNELHTN